MLLIRGKRPGECQTATRRDDLPPLQQTEPLQRHERRMCAKRRTGVCETAASEVPETGNRVWTHSNSSACQGPHTSSLFSLSACSSQKFISISRYIVVAV